MTRVLHGLEKKALLPASFFFQGFVAASLFLLFVLAPPAFAELAIIQDHAFIDNRPSDDPLLSGGLYLSLEVTPTDSVGGSVALGAGTATYTSNNVGYPFAQPGSMAWDTGRDRFDYIQTVTPARLGDISGTFTFTITDINGTVTDTGNPLGYLEVLQFPTNLRFSNQSTAPTFTFTDPNTTPVPAGITRAYQLSIYEVVDSALVGVYDFPAQLTTTFVVPGGVLAAGKVYDFRAMIIDADNASIGQPIHDMTEDRSNGWAFGFTPLGPVPIPGAKAGPAPR